MTENEVPGSAHAGAMSSEMAVSPSSAMSSNHVSFTPDISGMDVDASIVNATFGDDLGNGGPLQIGPNGGDSSSLGQQIWDFSLSDLSADLTNLGGNVLCCEILSCITLAFLISSLGFSLLV